MVSVSRFQFFPAYDIPDDGNLEAKGQTALQLHLLEEQHDGLRSGQS
jgi:hypothetical protein